MSLTTDFLADYLIRSEQSQADFARAAGMTQPNFSEILNGSVEVSARNIGKLIRGFREEHERDAFIAAYLRDQIPAENADRITVHLSTPTGVLEERPEADRMNIEVEMIAAFDALPSDLYRRRVVKFLNKLRKDEELRDLFRRTMEYLEE